MDRERNTGPKEKGEQEGGMNLTPSGLLRPEGPGHGLYCQTLQLSRNFSESPIKISLLISESIRYLFKMMAILLPKGSEEYNSFYRSIQTCSPPVNIPCLYRSYACVTIVAMVHVHVDVSRHLIFLVEIPVVS